jgi:hypothetical protein
MMVLLFQDRYLHTFNTVGCNKHSALHLYSYSLNWRCNSLRSLHPTFIPSLVLLDSGCCCGGHVTFPSSLPSHISNKDSIATQCRPIYPQYYPFISQHFIVCFSAASIKNSGQKRSADKANGYPRCRGLFQSPDN